MRSHDPARHAFAAALFLLAAAACAGGAGSSPRGDGGSPGSSAPGGTLSPAASASEAAPSEAPSGVPASAVPAAILGPIVADAATRAGVDPSQLTVAHAAAVEFNDGSLGCPEPGMAYTQAIVPGYQVILEHDGVRLDYRASGAGAFRLCPEGGEPLPAE